MFVFLHTRLTFFSGHQTARFTYKNFINLLILSNLHTLLSLFVSNFLQICKKYLFHFSTTHLVSNTLFQSISREGHSPHRSLYHKRGCVSPLKTHTPNLWGWSATHHDSSTHYISFILQDISIFRYIRSFSYYYSTSFSFLILTTQLARFYLIHVLKLGMIYFR